MWALTLNHFERENEASDIKVFFDRERLIHFAERQYHRREKSGNILNGRQIRNAFQIALAMGHSQRLKMLERKGVTPEQAAASGKKRLMEVKLTKDNLQNIAQATRAFDDYMQHLRGNDSVLARQSEVRDDHYDPAAPLAAKDYLRTPHGRGRHATYGQLRRGEEDGRHRSQQGREIAQDGQNENPPLELTRGINVEGTDESESEHDLDYDDVDDD